MSERSTSEVRPAPCLLKSKNKYPHEKNIKKKRKKREEIHK